MCHLPAILVNLDSKFETVLVMQGGGSLGAYECGAYKSLAKHGITFDIVAGTSIGAINAAIIAGTKTNNPVQDLEDFWLTIAETITPSVLPDSLRPVFSSTYGALWGSPNIFRRTSFFPYVPYFPFFMPPYLYDLSPLKETLLKFIDMAKLRGPDGPRLVMTSTDIQNSQSVTFDSKKMNIDVEHIIACAGFPFYGISWTQKDGRYLWDGSLQSNTPLREVIDASPRLDKKAYIINVFPHIQDKLPQTLLESWHRARDIIHSDKTYHNVRMSKVISRYLYLIKEMYQFIVTNTAVSQNGLDEINKEKLKKIEKEYVKLTRVRGAIISDIVRIERTEDADFLFEDADFSISTIRHLIQQGEMDAETVLTKTDSSPKS
jgi:NTE family protein